MANQTAIKVNTQPGEQLIADKYAHVIIMKVEESLSIVVCLVVY
jgi:threonine aldolase